MPRLPKIKKKSTQVITFSIHTTLNSVIKRMIKKKYRKSSQAITRYWKKYIWRIL